VLAACLPLVACGPPPDLASLAADRAYVAVTEDENVSSFVDTLQRKLAAHAAAVAAGGEAGGGLAAGGGGLTGGLGLGLASKSLADLTAAAGVTAGAGGIAEEMPFELRVLEVALDSVRQGHQRASGLPARPPACLLCGSAV
jgi:hypothetical protein